MANAGPTATKHRTGRIDPWRVVFFLVLPALSGVGLLWMLARLIG